MNEFYHIAHRVVDGTQRLLALLALAMLLTPSRAAAAPARTHEPQVIGYSVQGRPIHAYTVGQGERYLVFVGGIHGGAEPATPQLVAQAAEYFRQRAASIPRSLTLVFIPSANPDGLSLGWTRAGRFNANGVDLNRNWDCDWQPQSTWNQTAVSGGPSPFSEPETVALRDYIVGLQPVLTVFYHSQAGTVGTGVCGTDLPTSVEAARLVARRTGYAFAEWAFYEVSGDAVGYLNQEGLPAIEIELWTHTYTDWAINLAGIVTAQAGG